MKWKFISDQIFLCYNNFWTSFTLYTTYFWDQYANVALYVNFYWYNKYLTFSYFKYNEIEYMYKKNQVFMTYQDNNMSIFVLSTIIIRVWINCWLSCFIVHMGILIYCIFIYLYITILRRNISVLDVSLYIISTSSYKYVFRNKIAIV